ncbi:hypothetical protein M0805_006144 [Coniferiporia weirii]|nr:hypothetical protein M0805_006144 [Coniferiporia weirii]
MLAAHLLLPLLFGPLLAAAQDDQLHILHRLLVPDIEDQGPPFVLRATVDVSTRQLTPAPQFVSELAQFYRDARDHKDALYQLAIQLAPADDPANGRLDISSVKACHLPLAPADSLTLHLDDGGVPFHVDYYLAGVPPNGACPTNKQLRAVNLDQAAFLPPSNTSVRIRHATHPPLPELRVPPPLTPKGEPVAPAPEKTFLQKYWLYIAAALGLLLLTGGPPEEDSAGSGAAGGGR